MLRSQFCKIDLHVHTPEQNVQAALDQRLAAVAITDHNTAEWIDKVKAVPKTGSNNDKVEAAGAIDRPDVKKAVIAHMEGGDEPYILRASEYNIH